MYNATIKCRNCGHGSLVQYDHHKHTLLCSNCGRSYYLVDGDSNEEE